MGKKGLPSTRAMPSSLKMTREPAAGACVHVTNNARRQRRMGEGENGRSRVEERRVLLRVSSSPRLPLSSCCFCRLFAKSIVRRKRRPFCRSALSEFTTKRGVFNICELGSCVAISVLGVLHGCSSRLRNYWSSQLAALVCFCDA